MDAWGDAPRRRARLPRRSSGCSVRGEPGPGAGPRRSPPSALGGLWGPDLVQTPAGRPQKLRVFREAGGLFLLLRRSGVPSPRVPGEPGRADAGGRLPGARGPRRGRSGGRGLGTASPAEARLRAQRLAGRQALGRDLRADEPRIRGRTPARSEQRRLAERELSAASGTFSLFLSEHRPPYGFALLVLAQPREAAQCSCCCNATPAESFSVPCTQCHLGLNVPDFLYSSGPWFSTNGAFAPRGPLAAPGGRPSGRHTWSREAAADT